MEISFSKTDVLCNGADNGTIDLTATGDNTPFTYLWSNGETTEDVSNLSAGDYYVTVTDQLGCSEQINPSNELGSCFAISGILVNACVGSEWNEEMVMFQTGPNDINTSSMDVTWPNGTNPWMGLCNNSAFITNMNSTITGGGTLIEVTGNTLPANSNILLVTSSATTSTGMSFANLSDTLYVLFQCPPSNTAGHFANYNAAGGARTLIVDFGGGCSSSVTYQRDLLTKADGTVGDEDGASVQFDPAGNALYVNDGCEAPVQLVQNPTEIIILEPSPFIVTVNKSDPTCSNNDGMISVSAEGGTTTYSFSWSNGQSGQNMINLSEGAYTCTLTDANSCDTIFTVDLVKPETITAMGIATNPSCGASNGSVDVTVTGDGSPFSFDWSNSTNDEDLSNAPSGTYSVTISGDNICDTTLTFTLIDSGSIEAEITSVNPSCLNNDGSATATINGTNTPFSYSWSNSESTSIVSNLPEGTYSCTVSDGSGCDTIMTVNLVQPESITATISSTNPSCTNNDGTVTVTVTGANSPFSYSWSNDGTSQTISNLPEGTYTCSVSDSQSCDTTLSVTIQKPETITSSGVLTDPSCANNDGSIDVTTTGDGAPFSYEWSNGQNTEDISGLAEGIYIVTVSSDDVCDTTLTFVLEMPESFTVTLSSIDPTCNNNDGSITTTLTGGQSPFDYNWSSGGSSANLNGLPEGVYTVTVTDDNNCTVTESAVLNKPEKPIATGVVTPETCGGNDGSIDLTVTPNSSSTYEWNTGQTSEDISGLVKGTYTVTISDSDLCDTTLTFQVNENNTINPSTDTQPTDCNAATGVATAVVTGGASPYSFDWSNGGSSSTINNLPIGTYSVTIVDANGCDTTAIAIIEEPEPITSIDGITTKSGCETSTGIIEITNIEGGESPYTYSMDSVNFSSSNTFSSLAPGSYNVVVKDDANCTQTQPFIITKDTVILTATGIPVECGKMEGEVLATADSENGQSPFTFSMSNGESNGVGLFEGVSPGSYTVTLTDVNGCTDTKPVEVSEECPDFEPPDTFSPNGDGQNDVWDIPILTRYYPNCEVNVYDRWGQKVFHSNGYSEPWNGRYLGVPVAAANYYYVIFIVDRDKEAGMKLGDVAIVR